MSNQRLFWATWTLGLIPLFASCFAKGSGDWKLLLLGTALVAVSYVFLYRAYSEVRKKK